MEIELQKKKKPTIIFISKRAKYMHHYFKASQRIFFPFEALFRL